MRDLINANLSIPSATDLFKYWALFTHMVICKNIVGCQGVVQLRGSDSGLSLEGPFRVKACKSFLFTEGSLKDKIKSTYLSHESL